MTYYKLNSDLRVLDNVPVQNPDAVVGQVDDFCIVRGKDKGRVKFAAHIFH